MKKTIQWSTPTPPGVDLGATTLDEANEMVRAAGLEPLPRATLNLLYRTSGASAQRLVTVEPQELAFRYYGIGPKRFQEIDSWRSELLKVATPDAEPMSTAERVLVNTLRRKMPEQTKDASTGDMLEAIRNFNHTETLRDYLLELALLVPPGRDYSSSLRQWLLEVARG